ncbi:MAG: 30S ribosomal protein S15 [Candidatus Marinimicrobia bacterium]|nr:30S ribosomal protein S15 [Candidatus Neomarinimicrobiota bacterium]
MTLSSEKKQELINKFGEDAKDTGSPAVQVALLTQQIRDLTEHFKTHKKDNHGRRGLIRMVSKRRKLLTYLKRTNPEGYTALINELELRR